MARASLSQVVHLFVITFGATLPSLYCQNTKWPGTSCSADNDCTTPGERDTLMICNNNKCGCESSVQHFHYGTQNRCLNSASSRCSDNIDLTPHSTCVSRSTTCSATYPETAYKTCARTNGDACATTEDCDQDLFLQCVGTTNKKCACPPGSTFFADKGCQLNPQATCAVKDPLVPGPPVIRCPDHLDCVDRPEQEGVTNLICACAEGLVENGGTCVAPYGAQCLPGDDSKKPCDDSAFLDCVTEGTNSTCKCKNSAETVYDKNEKICKIQADKGCSTEADQQPCVAFSKCEDVSGENKCKCDTGLSAINGKCVIDYSGTCEEGEDKPPCNTDAYQECKDATCVCSRKDNTWYDGVECRLLENAACVNDPKNQQCVPFAHCTAEAGEDWHCACAEGLDVSNERTCTAPNGGECSTDGTDKAKCGEFQDCNPTGDGTGSICECQDPDNMKYDTENKACVLKLNSPCVKDDESQPQCEQFSECNEEAHVCRCAEGLVEAKDGTCKLSYDEDCSAANAPACNEDAFLECSVDSGKCVCKDSENAQFNATTATCELLPGVPCVEGTGNQPCTEMTECKDKDGAGFKCACDEGLIDSDKKCVMAFGGDCDDSKPDLPTCNTASYEFCNTNKHCACAEDLSSWRENITNKCVLFEGKKCEGTEDAQACVSFAHCKPADGATDMTCACDEKFTRSIEGTCVGLHDAPCGPANDAQCSADNFLECAADDSKCTCSNPAISFYDGKQCVLKVEADCINDPASQRCTEFSACNGAPGAAGTCACERGLEMSDEKTCITPYGGACGDGKAKCGKFQDCNVDSSTCLCEDPDNMIFDAVNKKCVLRVNAACKLNDPTAPECAEFSECQDPVGLCKCRSDLTETKDGACALPYDGDCSIFDGPKCNADAYLECMDGLKCACLNFDNSYYNSDLQRCQLLIGAACSPSGQECTTTSFCDTNNKCNCKEGSEASSDGTHCVEVEIGAGFGQVCSANGDCNGNAWLICTTNRTCGCSANSWYNPRTSKCELLAGGACNGTQKCTEFAECVAGACACLPNYIPSHDNLCSASFGAACASFDDCSRDAFLVCGPAYTCVCGWYNSWFNPRSGKCELLANEPCAPGSGGQPCTEFSKCDASSGYKCVCDEDFVTTSKHKCAHESCECDDWDVNQESFLLRNSVEKEI